MNHQQASRKMKQAVSQCFSNVRLYVIISSRISKKPVLETLEEVIEGGADAVQLREKTLSNSEFISLAREFRKITSRSKTLFIVNDHAEISREVDADGLHIGQSDITIKTARKVIGYNRILGVSTHNMMQARSAQREGADYLGVGPIFSTATKDYEPPVGLDYLQQVKREITIPFVAIGAVNLKNLNEVLDAGGSRIAICSAIISSDNIIQTTRLFKARIIAEAAL